MAKISARGMYGHRSMPGEVVSEKYPGMIQMQAGRYKKRTVWFDEARGRYRSANQYYHEVACTVCGKMCLQADGNSARGARPVCGNECWTILRTVPVGSRKRSRGSHGYVMVKKPSHHRAGVRTGYVREHILVAERKLGRDISVGECVHHINCVQDDNRPENLHVFRNTAEHHIAHGSLNLCVKQLIDAEILRFNAVTEKYECL